MGILSMQMMLTKGRYMLLNEVNCRKEIWLKVRYGSTVSTNIHVGNSPSKDVKPFSAIPGPMKVPILGTLLPYKLGLKKLPSYHHDVCKLYQKYGPVVREVFGSCSVIHVFDPKDIQAVYESDIKMPHIPPLQETTQFYRQQKDMSLGLGNLNGEEWYKLRHAVQQMMLRPKEVSYYFPLQDGVACRAVDRLLMEVDREGSVHNLHLLVAKWILESSGMCCFEKSLGCLNEGVDEDLAQRLVEGNMEIFKLSAELKFSLRLYHYFTTPKYKRLHKLEDFFYGISLNFINDTIEEVRTLMAEKKLKEGEYNFISYLMSREELSDRDVVIITLSLFSDGLSTTAPTFLGNLHCLALNPQVQERLYEEIKTHVDPDAPLTFQVISKMHFLKAFVKEVFRFYPVGESVQRLPQRDMVLGGYHIPAGTYLDLNPYVWLRSSDHFKEPEKLYPERWLRHTAGSSTVNPYILNPFSIGTRMCAGRRFAEQDLFVGLCRLMLKFRVEATSSDPPEQEWSMLLRPKIPLPIRFVVRE